MGEDIWGINGDGEKNKEKKIIFFKKEKENKGPQMAFESISIMKWTFTNQCPSIHCITVVRSSQITAGCGIIR